MSYNLVSYEVSKLFQIRKPSEIITFLNDLESKAKGQWKWRSLGDRVANASNVHVLTEPGPAVVERITNGIDAMLELQHSEAGSPIPGPPSPRQASEEWFGIQGGTLNRDKDDQAINALGPNVRVHVFDSGQPRRPSIAITDRGIGQHPFALPSTILSLGASNKIGKQYLCGAYGQGGSATFAWCEYTIIVSRRRPQHSDGKLDLVGWTIVRRYDDIDLKLYTYQYLVNEAGEIPIFAPSALSDADFEFGTYIIHISYELGRLAALWSIVGYRYLNNLLFDPVLPYTIHDHREPQPQDRYMYGSRGRLVAVSVEHYNEYVADLGPDGSVAIRYWVFRERNKNQENDVSETSVNIDSYLESHGSSRNIVVTLNGQRHAYLDRSFLKNTVRYPLLADTLLVQVDCDKLSRLRKKDLFPATRSGIVSGEGRLELVEHCVEEALKTDKDLSRLEHERIQKRLATVDEESERKVKRLLDQLISISKPVVGPGADTKGGVGQVHSGQKEYKPKDPPTYFKFAEEKQILHIMAGSKTIIDVITDGPDDMLTRKKRRGNLTLETLGDQTITLRAGTLHEGRLGVNVAADETANVSAICQLRAVLEMDGGVYFVTQRPCAIASPPPPYVGQEPPAKLTIAAPGGTVKLRRSRTSQVTIDTDCKDDLLSRPINPGQFEVETTIPGVILSARRGPRNGRIEAFLNTPDEVGSFSDTTQHSITARLTLFDGTYLEDTKPCVVVEPPSEDQQEGKKKRPQANYEIIEVWREPPTEKPGAWTWDKLSWGKTDVGKYDLTQLEGNDFLLLYVNMDNEDLVKERERRLRKSGEGARRRLEIRYKAYIGHHLWLHSQGGTKAAVLSGIGGQNNQSDQEDLSEGGTNDYLQAEAELQEEMRRVAKTIILAMRSEADIFSEIEREELEAI